MYGRQLKEWLNYFQASQFIIIPMRAYIREGPAIICKEVASRYNESLCDGRVRAGQEPEHLNVHDHLPLDDDAPRDLLAKVRKLFDADNALLVKVLAKAHSNGAILYGLKPHSSKAQVRHWLQ